MSARINRPLRERTQPDEPSSERRSTVIYNIVVAAIVLLGAQMCAHQYEPVAIDAEESEPSSPASTDGE